MRTGWRIITIINTHTTERQSHAGVGFRKTKQPHDSMRLFLYCSCISIKDR
jgi:hypothetical protein